MHIKSQTHPRTPRTQISGVGVALGVHGKWDIHRQGGVVQEGETN